MFALNQRLPCVRGAGAERLRGWRDVFKAVRCSALRTTNPSVIFLRKCHLPLHKGGLKGECAAICLVLAVCFNGASRTSPPTMNGGIRCSAILFGSHHLFSNGRFNISLRFMAHLLRKYVIARDVVRAIIRLRANERLSRSL